MKINGPYYSDTLLNIILSESVRWTEGVPHISQILDTSFDGGQEFQKKGCIGICERVAAGQIDVTLVQAVLLLSVQEGGKGNRTHAWLYGGLAFRMLDELGISIDGHQYAGFEDLTEEDAETRNRVFWSCYFWDKTLALLIGRTPYVRHTSVSLPRLLDNDVLETEEWYPHGISLPEGMQYPPTSAYKTTCFINMCVLSKILNEVLMHIYAPDLEKTEIGFYTCIREQAINLTNFWEELPDYLKLVPGKLPLYCPPTNIVLLK